MKNNKVGPIRAEVVKALAYARVSSKEQEKEGFSIPAQQKLLQSYAANNRFIIVQEYVDIETAKATGRTNFEQMVRYLKTHPNVRTVLVEKTDRLYRNLRDQVVFKKDRAVTPKTSQALGKLIVAAYHQFAATVNADGHQ
jgi:predicted site-specific integrase-resolvase